MVIHWEDVRLSLRRKLVKWRINGYTSIEMNVQLKRSIELFADLTDMDKWQPFIRRVTFNLQSVT